MRIVLLGDSRLARGQRPLPRTGLDVVNAAVGGSVATDVLAQAAQVCVGPDDAVVLSIGTTSRPDAPDPARPYPDRAPGRSTSQNADQFSIDPEVALMTSSPFHRRTALVASSLAAVAAPLALGFASTATAAGTDSDHDGMPNRWERVHHLDPHRANGRANADHDGLRNLAEFRRNLDPRDEDTDNDGDDDGDEVHDGSASTNPHDADTDNDGTVDGDEDADRDQVDNEDEDDADESCVGDDDDADSDGVDNEDENENGTEANDADSDNDGVEDGNEDSDDDGVEDEDADDDAGDLCSNNGNEDSDDEAEGGLDTDRTTRTSWWTVS